MKERPILFNAPMVREVLAGTKTQTRRIGKTQCAEWTELAVEYSIHAKKGKVAVATHLAYPNGSARHGICECPYGIPGDRLWVRESFARVPTACGSEDIVFAADYQDGSDRAAGVRYTPSIHMPRAVSRITLEITGVRVERLQDISRGDAMAEGCPFPNMAQGPDPRDWYAELWGAINGPDSWAENPWAWVVEFKAIEAKP